MVVFIVTSYMSVCVFSFVIVIVVFAARHVHYALACIFEKAARPCANTFPDGIDDSCDADGDGDRIELTRPIASIATDTASSDK